MAESQSAAQPARKKVTIPTLMEKIKKATDRAARVYDYETAIIADRVGIDILCVSDTGGWCCSATRTPLGVVRGSDVHGAGRQTRIEIRLGMVDMQYISFHLSPSRRSTTREVRLAGRCRVMKCEGNQHTPRTSRRSSSRKRGARTYRITPMRMAQLGGFTAQGKTAERAKELIDERWRWWTPAASRSCARSRPRRCASTSQKRCRCR